MNGHVVAQCIQDENRERLKDHGADAVIRPVRAVVAPALVPLATS